MSDCKECYELEGQLESAEAICDLQKLQMAKAHERVQTAEDNLAEADARITKQALVIEELEAEIETLKTDLDHLGADQ